MNHMVTRESFGSLASYWRSGAYNLNWAPVFVLPVWLEVWWREFRPEAEINLLSVKQDSDIIGIAPLQAKGKEASFAGDVGVCDYMDFIVAPGRERDFFGILLEDLNKKSFNYLDLGHVRPDSAVVVHLAEVARGRGCEVSCSPDTVSLELNLPPAWEEYLGLLATKQRHEIGRKLRRLGEAGTVNYRTIEDRTAVQGIMDTFLKLFKESREEKAAFLTDRMESFFRSMAVAMAGESLLRIGILELETIPAAMVMCFDYNNTVYLYNSGYDPQYRALSAGLLSKVLCIKDSIQRGRKRYDFLKGAEKYKYHLGGREIPLYRCRIKLG